MMIRVILTSLCICVLQDWMMSRVILTSSILLSSASCLTLGIYPALLPATPNNKGFASKSGPGAPGTPFGPSQPLPVLHIFRICSPVHCCLETPRCGDFSFEVFIMLNIHPLIDQRKSV